MAIYEMGERLRELRESMRLSQVEAAKRIGITSAAISAYEHNANQPSAEVIAKLAGVYNTTADYILGLTADKTKGRRYADDTLSAEQKAVLHEINQLIVKLSK